MSLTANSLLLKMFNLIQKLDGKGVGVGVNKGLHTPFPFVLFLNSEGVVEKELDEIKSKIFPSSVQVLKESFNSVEPLHTQNSLHHFSFSSCRSVRHCRSNLQCGHSFQQ